MAANELMPYPEDTGRTHFEGCWRERGHHNCAVAEIERLRAPAAVSSPDRRERVNAIADALCRAYERHYEHAAVLCDEGRPYTKPGSYRLAVELAEAALTAASVRDGSSAPVGRELREIEAWLDEYETEHSYALTNMTLLQRLQYAITPVAPPEPAFPPCPRCHHPHLDYLDDEGCVSCGCPWEDDAKVDAAPPAGGTREAEQAWSRLALHLRQAVFAQPYPEREQDIEAVRAALAGAAREREE